MASRQSARRRSPIFASICRISCVASMRLRENLDALRGVYRRLPDAWPTAMLLVLLAPGPACAQFRHRIGMAIGGFRIATRDALAAPVPYRGGGTPFSLSYQYTGNEFRHLAAVRFSKTGFGGRNLERRPGQANGGHAEYLLVEWAYSYSRRLGESEDSLHAWQFFAGPGWSNTVHVREYFYTPENSEISWEVFSSIGFEADVIYHMRRADSRLSVFTPVISYMNRPPYAVKGDEVFRALFDRSRWLKLGRISSFNRLFALTASLEYGHRIAPSVRASAGYHVTMYRYRTPRTTAVMLQELRIGIGVLW